MDTNPRRTAIGIAIFAVTGGLMIALPATIEKHADRVAIGAGIGAAAVTGLLAYGVANRGGRATSGRPALLSAVGIAAASAGIALGQAGLDGNFVLGLLGGMLLTYAVGVVVLPLVVRPRH